MRLTKRIYKILFMLLLFGLILIPTTLEAAAQTGATLNFEVVEPEIYDGGIFQVKVTVAEASDLYGLQVKCLADPQRVTWQSVQFGDFFTAALVGSNQIDSETGEWLGAVSQKNPAPALSGGGLYATLTFEAVAPGEVSLDCTPVAVDRNGMELPMTVASSPITILDSVTLPGGIHGLVTYQGRTSHSSIVVSLEGPFNKEFQTGDDGNFTLENLKQGKYGVKADAALYLPSCTAVSVTGEITTLAATMLIGGDTNDDDEIKINDATLLGSNFGLSATSSPAMDARADINADGKVNIQDLSILGGNFGKNGCQTWSPEQTSIS